MNIKSLAPLLLLAAAAFAAGVSGTWKATSEGPNGAMERTFVFQVDGAKLTGETTSSLLGKSVIENGKVEGDSLSFGITARMQDNELKINYKGKVSGDTIKLSSEVVGGQGQIMEWTGKRVP